MTNKQAYAGLLPCPFCGGDFAMTKSTDPVHPYRVTCRVCGCGTAHHGDATAALESWNTRPEAAEAISSLLKALEGVLPRNVCLTNRNIPDDTVVPLECTMGDLRRIAAALSGEKL